MGAGRWGEGRGRSQCNSNERARRATHMNNQVAVKKLIQQHFSPEQMKDFLDEINMMKYAAAFYYLFSFLPRFIICSFLFLFLLLLLLCCCCCLTAVNARTTRAGSCTIPTWCC